MVVKGQRNDAQKILKNLCETKEETKCGEVREGVKKANLICDHDHTRQGEGGVRGW